VFDNTDSGEVFTTGGDVFLTGTTEHTAEVVQSHIS